MSNKLFQRKYHQFPEFGTSEENYQTWHAGFFEMLQQTGATKIGIDQKLLDEYRKYQEEPHEITDGHVTRVKELLSTAQKKGIQIIQFPKSPRGIFLHQLSTTLRTIASFEAYDGGGDGKDLFEDIAKGKENVRLKKVNPDVVDAIKKIRARILQKDQLMTFHDLGELELFDDAMDAAHQVLSQQLQTELDREALNHFLGNSYLIRHLKRTESIRKGSQPIDYVEKERPPRDIWEERKNTKQELEKRRERVRIFIDIIKQAASGHKN